MHGAVLASLSLSFVLLWSSGWVVSGFAIDDVGVYSLLTFRYLIALAILALYISLTGGWKKIKRVNIRLQLMIGVLAHAMYLLAGLGAFELGVSVVLVAFVTAMHPMLTAAMSGYITAEKISARQWAGLGLGICAVLLLISEGYKDGVSGYALLLPLISVIALSIGTLLSRRVELSNKVRRRKRAPLSVLLFLHCAGALCLFIPAHALFGPDTIQIDTGQWLIILWLAIGVTLGAYALMLILLRYISAMQVSSLGYLVPPVTMIQSYFLFGETVTLLDLTALIIAAVSVYLVMSHSSDESADKRSNTGIGKNRRFANRARPTVRRSQLLVDIEL